MSVAAPTQTAVVWPDINNHTLRGEAVPASDVVTRNCWGTPMLPDGKGGYSLIAPINQDFINQSLIIPPRTSNMVAFRPLPAETEADTPAVAAPVAPAPAAAAPLPQ